MENIIELRTKPRAFEKGDHINIAENIYRVISVNTENRSFDIYTLIKITKELEK